MSAISLDASANRIASFWLSFSVGSTHSTSPTSGSPFPKSAGTGAGDDSPNNTLIKGEYSASPILPSRSIVAFILLKVTSSATLTIHTLFSPARGPPPPAPPPSPSSLASSTATPTTPRPTRVTTPFTPFPSNSLTSLFRAPPAGCSATSTMSPTLMPCSGSSALLDEEEEEGAAAVAGSGPSSSTVLPPSPVRCAATVRLVRATPARWRAAGECRATRAEDSAISAASSEARSVSWVWANVGISTAIFIPIWSFCWGVGWCGLV